jgi:hypothetical protein
MRRSKAWLSSDRTAAIVAIEGNQTVGVSLPERCEATGPGSPARRIPTTQRFISNVLIGFESIILSVWHNRSQRLMNALGFGAEQRVNQGIAINPGPPMHQSDPRAAYAARTTQLNTKLARLQQLADDHFGHDPDAVHWGHVGDLGRVEQALDDLLAIFDGQPE